MKLRIHALVLEGMRREARRYSIETGGILVGPDGDTISELIPSGNAAYRSHSEYELDPVHLQPLLDDAQRRGLRFLGVWHVHPEGYRELSRTDLATARRMLRDRSYGMRRVLMPLTVRTGAELETRFFIVDGKEPKANEAGITVIHKQEEERSTLEQSCGRSSSAPGARAFAALANGERLVADRRALEHSGWTVAIRDCEQTLVVRVTKSDIALCAVCPAEYPLNPPDIFVETEDGLEPVSHDDLPETRVWSSERSLAAVINQASRAVEIDREAHALFRISPLRRLMQATAQLARSAHHGE